MQSSAFWDVRFQPRNDCSRSLKFVDPCYDWHSYAANNFGNVFAKNARLTIIEVRHSGNSCVEGALCAQS